MNTAKGCGIQRNGSQENGNQQNGNINAHAYMCTVATVYASFRV